MHEQGCCTLSRSFILFYETERLVGGLGFPEIVVIVVIALVIFGPNRLPALGESLGKAIRGFKEGLKDDQPVDKIHDQSYVKKIG